jgi:molybdate transport system substrate-binding protein
MSKQRLLLFSLGALLCSTAMIPASAQDTVTLYAAASLKDVFDEIGKAYEKDKGIKIVASYGATPALAKQIEHGAPADIFLSADTDWMDYVETRKLVKPGSRRNLLTNSLVLIQPVASKVKLKIVPGFPLAKLLRNDRLAVADPNAVPAGKYAKASLESLGVWKEVEPRIAPTENVRAALLLVSRGETPFGIVYRTDALADSKVRIVGEFPATTHPLIVYPAAITSQSGSAAALEFLAYLSSPVARQVFEKHGFKTAQ